MAACLGHAGKGESDLVPFAALAGLISKSGMPAPINASSAPSVSLSADAGLPSDVIKVQESAVQLPQQIEGTFVPVGKVYDVGPDTQGQPIPGNLYLPNNGVAKFVYSYDADELESGGFLQEFAGFYYDKGQQAWLPVDKLEVNASARTVTVYTRHFTPFVLTAIPAASGGIADAPACIAEDFPSGIGGTGGALFTVVDTDFKYYQDRSYTINRTGGSFDKLGFNGALAISTCNGDSTCGSFAKHKMNTGTNYIQFTAHTNIDLYLMYDTRGGTDQYDDTQDAPWIKGSGFVNTGEFVGTSDAVGQYRVYKKSYNKGDLVSLDDNRAGVTASGIQTNYWVVIKRQGVTGAEPAAKTCEKKPSLSPVLAVSNPRAAPGADRIALGFQTPDDEDFAGVVIRRSTTAAPARIGDGIAATGVALSPTGYRDESLKPDTTYFYTIFALDKNGSYGPGVSIAATTGQDTDGDGLSDAFETTYTFASGSKADPNNADTDGDGIPDGQEFAQGTDPTVPDQQKPVITAFQTTASSPTNDPYIPLSVAGSDNTAVTGWAITLTDTPPVSWGDLWKPAAQTYYQFARAGDHQLYAWAKDAAGNVSAALAPIAVDLEGINETRYAIVSVAGANTIDVFKVDPVNGTLQSISSLPLPFVPGFLKLHPNGKFLYAPKNELTTEVAVLHFDGSSGALTLAGIRDTGGSYPYEGSFDPTGRFLYLPCENSGTLSWLSIDQNTGDLTYLGSIGTGSHPVSALATTGNHLYVANRYGDEIWHYTLDGSTGAPSAPFNAATVSAPYTLQLAPDGAHVLATSYISSSTGDQPATAFLIQPGGSLTSTGSQIAGRGPAALAPHPTGRFMYVSNLLASDITRLALDTNGVLSAPQHYSSPAGPVGIAVHSSGRFLFVAGYNANKVSTFRIDPLDGSLTETSSAPVAGNAHYIALQDQHDGNDPPVVNAGSDRWTKVGDSTALHGHNTMDPDATRCNADSSKYAAAWSFVSKPAGSGLNDASIVNGNTLTSARFIPDVSGDYRLRLSFTDDPGSCQGSAKTRAAEVVIHAGYQHTQSVDSYDTLPSAPGLAPEFRNTGTLDEDWGGDMLWAVTLKADPVQYLVCQSLRNYFNNICSNPASWGNPYAAIAACAIRNSMNCEAQFDLVYSIICMSPEAHRPDAQQFCELVAETRPKILINGTHVRVDINRGHFWVHGRWRTHYKGYWQYWAYN